MPKETFMRLSVERKEEIQQILLDIFFIHPISQIRVSEIVNAMGMSRGAFYKYFENIEDAYSYLVAKYADDIHIDILKEIKKEGNNLLKGTENYLINCGNMEFDCNYWKILNLLFRENKCYAFRLPNINIDDILIKRWLDLLHQNKINITDEHEAISFLYFMAEIVIDILRDFSINKWDVQTMLREYHFKMKWIYQGLE